jgi:predicted nucleic acid-binding Zn finger protein
MLIRFTSALAMHTRTYFVGGHRVEHVRDALGQSSATCDCSEYLDGMPRSGQRWCQHVERITAAEQLEQLMLTPALIVSAGRY